MDLTFGAMGTLPDDIIGKSHQKSGAADEVKPSSGNSELSDIWAADYQNAGISLVSNSGAMADRPPETSEKVSENMEKVLNESRKMMMTGCGYRQLEQSQQQRGL